MNELAARKCEPCDNATKALKGTRLQEMKRKLANPKWKLVKGKLEQEYKFKYFKQALAYTNKVGAVAAKIGHHPNISLTYGEVKIQLWTHKANGLTENDFVLAAKIDQLK